MKESSIDCSLNSVENEPINCFSFGSRTNPGEYSYIPDINKEFIDNYSQETMVKINAVKIRYPAKSGKIYILNRDNDVTVNVVDSLLIPSEDFDITSENLALHPELLKYDKLYKSIEQSELLNQKESSPMIGFGLDYINVAERPNMDFSDNGKDIVMPMVSVSIPIFNKKYKSQTKQNDLQQQEITAQKQERLNALETLLDKANNERISARISYATQTKNLKQAKDAKDILIKSYETGTIDFNDVLDIQELQLKFQMNQIESIRTYYVQSTIINYLTQQ